MNYGILLLIPAAAVATVLLLRTATRSTRSAFVTILMLLSAAFLAGVVFGSTVWALAAAGGDPTKLGLGVALVLMLSLYFLFGGRRDEQD